MTVADERVRVAGRTVRYRATGDPANPPVIMLHGIGRSLEDFTDQHDLLDDQYRVYSVDLAGFGESDPLPGDSTLPAITDAVAALFGEIGETRPAHLVGNSLGGAVAMLLALRHPDRVRSLLLVNSAGFGREVTIVLRLLALRPLGKLLLRPSRSASRRSEQAIFRNRDFVTEARVQRALELSRRPHGARVMLDLSRSLGTFRGVRRPWRDAVIAATAAAAVPTLVVWGSHDLVLPAAHLDAAKRVLPHARTHLFTDTGHMPQIERAEEFAQLSKEFWASVPELPAPG
jgi:pimeloyl-ACP methyl ester carboxylesterase